MLTKEQKKQQIERGAKELKNAKSLIFADFTGVKTSDVRNLKNILRAMGATYTVFKKRLLKIAMKNVGVDVDPKAFPGQLGTVFSPKAIYDAASIVQKFAKDLLKTAKVEFKILGAYDAGEKKFYDAAQFATIAKLPSREVLLAQIAMMLTMPMKKVMVAINSRVEQLQKS